MKAISPLSDPAIGIRSLEASLGGEMIAGRLARSFGNPRLPVGLSQFCANAALRSLSGGTVL